MQYTGWTTGKVGKGNAHRLVTIKVEETKNIF